MIFTESQPKYSVLDLGFDKSLTKVLLGLQGEITPELVNVFSGGTVPRTLIAGELIVALEQQAGVVFSGKTTFSNTEAGYRLGIDSDGTVKFYMGDSSNYLNWTGTTFTIAGTVNALAGYFGSDTNGITINSTGLTIAGSGVIATGASPDARVQMIRSGTYGHALEGYDATNTLRWSWTHLANPYLRMLTGGNDAMHIFNTTTSGTGSMVLLRESGVSHGFEFTGPSSGSNTTSREAKGGFYFNNNAINHGDGLRMRNVTAGWDGNFIHIIPDTTKNSSIFYMEASAWSAVQPSRIMSEGYINFPAYHHRSEFDDAPAGTALTSTVVSNTYWVGGGTAGTQEVSGGAVGGDFGSDTWSYLKLSTTGTASRSSTATFRRNVGIVNESMWQAMVKVNSITNTKWELGWKYDANNYAFFRFDTAVDAANIYFVYNAGGGETLTDTSVDAGTASFKMFRMQIYPSNIIYAYINDVLCSTGTPTLPSQGAPYFYIDNKAAAEEKIMYVDYVEFWQGRKMTP